MDKRSVKLNKGFKNMVEENIVKPKPSTGFPSIAGNIKHNLSNGGTDKTVKVDLSPVKPTISSLPPLPHRENTNMAATPTSKASRRMSGIDQGPQTAEFAYSKAVELALRKFGFWSSRPGPRGFKSKYLEADIPCLKDIYKDYVFMRRSRGESTRAPQQNFDGEYRQTMLRPHPVIPSPSPILPRCTPVGRDTPMPGRLQSGSGVTRFPSLAVEFRMKKPLPKPLVEGTSSRRSSVMSMSLQ